MWSDFMLKHIGDEWECVNNDHYIHLRKSKEYISKKLDETDLLTQAAEECSELIQALMKRYRIITKHNPTTTTESDNKDNIIEEWSDLCLVMELLGYEADPVITQKKKERWAKRLKDFDDGKEII